MFIQFLEGRFPIILQILHRLDGLNKMFFEGKQIVLMHRLDNTFDIVAYYFLASLYPFQPLPVVPRLVAGELTAGYLRYKSVYQIALVLFVGNVEHAVLLLLLGKRRSQQVFVALRLLEYLGEGTLFLLVEDSQRGLILDNCNVCFLYFRVAALGREFLPAALVSLESVDLLLEGFEFLLYLLDFLLTVGVVLTVGLLSVFVRFVDFCEISGRLPAGVGERLWFVLLDFRLGRGVFEF